VTDELTPQVGEQPEDDKPTPQPPAPESKSDWKDAEIEKARREAAKRRVENKDLKTQLDAVTPKLAKIDTLEQQVAKLADLLQKAEDARKQTELSAARTSAAAKYGLPPELAKRVQGDTPDAIDADAAELAKAIPQPTKGPRFTGNSGENVSGPKQVVSLVERMRGRKQGPSEASDPNIHKAKGGGVVGIDH
jgi:hypothetical protein